MNRWVMVGRPCGRGATTALFFGRPQFLGVAAGSRYQFGLRLLHTPVYPKGVALKFFVGTFVTVRFHIMKGVALK